MFRMDVTFFIMEPTELHFRGGDSAEYDRRTIDETLEVFAGGLCTASLKADVTGDDGLPHLLSLSFNSKHDVDKVFMLV
jgi:hypothetical protein